MELGETFKKLGIAGVITRAVAAGAAIATTVTLFANCARTEQTARPLPPTSQIALAVITGAVLRSEDGPRFISQPSSNESDRRRAPELACCPSLSTFQCTGAQVEASYSNCRVCEVGPDIQLRGRERLRFNTGICTSLIGMAQQGTILNRTFEGYRLSFKDGAQIALESAATTPGGLARAGGVNIKCTGRVCNESRELEVLGVRARTESWGAQSWDLGVWGGGIRVEGAGSARRIYAGSLNLDDLSSPGAQHESEDASGDKRPTSFQAFVDEPLRFREGCTFPIGGKIRTEWQKGEGDLFGTSTQVESLRFTGNCGTARLTSASGDESTIELIYLF